VLNGRYGPYITDKERNARMPKGRDPKSLTLEECRALLAAAPPRRKGGFRGRKAAPREAAKEAAANTTAEAVPAKPKKPRARRTRAGPGKPPAETG
jgi:DNA topoisomerase-1